MYQPRGVSPWEQSHAMLPTPLRLEENLWRIYFSSRNIANQSYISFFDVFDTGETLVVKEASESYVLAPGRLGTFDDNGVSPSCALWDHQGRLLLYYIGWNPGSTTRVNLFGGLCLEDQEGSFIRYSEAPLLERTINDPLMNTAPWVVREGQDYWMFYVSGKEWRATDFPTYNIKIASSNDGKNWNRNGKVVLDFSDEKETALARPFVIREKGIWRMWFAKRVGEYSIGYAESVDGFNWKRMDEKYGLPVPGLEGQRKMVEYAVVLQGDKGNWLLYNGDNYGERGILYAKGEHFDC